MNSKLNRRRFIKNSMLASAGAGVAAQAAETAAPSANPKVAFASKASLPMGRIGKLKVSRMISGGNLISGWSHSRDLHYVASLMRAYNSDDKVIDTLQLLEEHGVNTILADPRKKPMTIFERYWKERGGKIQWIAEGHPGLDDWKTNIKQSIDFGASAVYVQGVISDRWLQQGKLDLLGNCVEFIKSQGVPAGIGAHQLEVIQQSEKNKYGAEFYVKTLHHSKYWSARRSDQHANVVDNAADNYWSMQPEDTIRFMQTVEKPWIAFKVLAAGAIQPESGFRYAFENGADFICVGMFDFQVEQNVKLALTCVRETQNRQREWMA